MQRILTILILAILLLPSPPVGKPAAVKAGALLVTVRPLPLVPAEPDRRWAGALLYQGAWEVRSDNPGFGGISALLATPHGDMLGLSDSGLLMGFHVGDQPAQRRPFIAPLPVKDHFDALLFRLSHELKLTVGSRRIHRNILRVIHVL